MLVQNPGSSSTFLAQIEDTGLCMVSLYVSGKDIVIRLEGIFTKRLYNSFYIKTGLVESFKLKNTL